MRKSALHFVDITAWVDSGRIDPVKHRLRQATHILLAAIASIRPPYALYLKRGLLLGLVYNSPRMTTDIDLTADFQPCEGIDIEIKKALNKTLPAIVAMLG